MKKKNRIAMNKTASVSTEKGLSGPAVIALILAVLSGVVKILNPGWWMVMLFSIGIAYLCVHIAIVNYLSGKLKSWGILDNMVVVTTSVAYLVACAFMAEFSDAPGTYYLFILPLPSGHKPVPLYDDIAKYAFGIGIVLEAFWFVISLIRLRQQTTSENNVTREQQDKSISI